MTDNTNNRHRQELEAREAVNHAHNYRHECMQSYLEARNQIETKQALGRSTYALEVILRHAELNKMTYNGAEQMLVSSGRLKAILYDR